MEKRRSLFALRAFNCAILTSIQKVSQPVFAQARIEFLKTGVAQIYKKQPHQEHPVLDELKLAINKHKLPRSWVNRLITERLTEDRLNRRPFASLSDLESYHEKTTGGIWLLSLMACDVQDVNCDVAAKHAARCIGLANALRAQQMIQTREILLPLEYTVKHQVNPRDLVEKKNNEEIEEMIFDIASVANANLTKVQSMRSKIPYEANDVFRGLTPVEHYLKSLESVNFDLFHPSLSQRNDLLALQLFKKRCINKF